MSRFKELMISKARQNNSRIILALDVKGEVESRLERALTILDEVHQKIASVKINFHLILPFGLEHLRPLLKYCSEHRLPIIADLKLNDIGSTNEEVASLLIRYGINAIIANPIAGFDEGLASLVELSSLDKLGLILLVYMSHKGAKETYSLPVSETEKLYTVFADKARLWRADGVIVSSMSKELIQDVRGRVGASCMILTPGVGVQGGDASKAISSGSDFIIVGRSIVESQSPLAAAETFRVLAPFYMKQSHPDNL
ncbi:MAG: orotidine-5'-phosphate decarboxylase [Conexivisphaerales archaeon]